MEIYNNIKYDFPFFFSPKDIFAAPGTLHPEVHGLQKM